MKNYKTISGFLLTVAFLASAGNHVIAAPGDSISGGGQILESKNKISFGIWANELEEGIEGEVQINFHRTGSLKKDKFHGNEVTELNFFAPDSDTCNAAMNMTVEGTLNRQPGYSVIFRAGDAGSPGNTTAAEPFDTVRVELYYDDQKIYDTHDGDYTDQSTCVGTARTGLDRGNMTIEHP